MAWNVKFKPVPDNIPDSVFKVHERFGIAKDVILGTNGLWPRFKHQARKDGRISQHWMKEFEKFVAVEIAVKGEVVA